MLWDCEKQGCFNVKRRPKIEVFADCFPGKINFGDVDAIVEINGKGLFMEWKNQNSQNLPLGQKIMYSKLTQTGLLTVLIVCGNAETMVCNQYSHYFMGNHNGWFEGDLNKIKEVIKKWVKWAKK